MLKREYDPFAFLTRRHSYRGVLGTPPRAFGALPDDRSGREESTRKGHLLHNLRHGGVMDPPVRISAKSIIADIRSNTSASDLMKKYGLSSRGLTKIFNKLISAGLLEAQEIVERYPSGTPMPLGTTASKDTPLSLSIPVPIYDRDFSTSGTLREVSSGTIRVAGIKAQVGETRNFHIPVDDFMADDPLEVTTECTGVDAAGEEKDAEVASFELVNLTNSQRDKLNRFIKVMFLSNSGEWRIANP